jgi:hypothetical protein
MHLLCNPPDSRRQIVAAREQRRGRERRAIGKLVLID